LVPVRHGGHRDAALDQKGGIAMNHLDRMDREQFIFWQLSWFAEHESVTFDVTFYDHEPILEVTLAKSFARKLISTLLYGANNLAKLLKHVAFSDGTITDFRNIWTLNYMPREFDLTSVDLTKGETVAGAQGETIREMISDTYHCKTRAEEDFFLSRWLAS
jgi:hypothetical protein